MAARAHAMGAPRHHARGAGLDGGAQRGRGALCHFGKTMGALVKCGVNVSYRSQPPRKGRTDRFKVFVKVWEDGSYVILYPATTQRGAKR